MTPQIKIFFLNYLNLIINYNQLTITSTLIINKLIGNQCKNNKRNSEQLIHKNLKIPENTCPCCLKEYKYKEYAALKKDINEIDKIVNQDQLTKLFNNIISLIKLIEGGAAILQEHNKNHQMANLGKKFNIPLFKNKLRLPVRSYNKLTKQNNPEEHNPWEIIIIKAPSIPQKFIVINPPNTNLIWATEE